MTTLHSQHQKSLLFTYCCIITPKFRGLKNPNISSFTLSVDQRSECGLARVFWLKISHEFTIKLLARVAVSSDSMSRRPCTSKLKHVFAGRFWFLSGYQQKTCFLLHKPVYRLSECPEITVSSINNSLDRSHLTWKVSLL